jgi:hypothetical protein
MIGGRSGVSRMYFTAEALRRKEYRVTKRLVATRRRHKEHKEIQELKNDTTICLRQTRLRNNF